MVYYCIFNYFEIFKISGFETIKKMTYEDRLKKILDLGYEVICNKTANGSVEIENEASFQLQLGVVLQSIGKQYEFSASDFFSLELEKKYYGTKTEKSKNGSRCDIYMQFEDLNDKTENKINTKSVAVELKYLRETEASTDHRFSILMDIENCEEYYRIDNHLSSVYCIVCCTEEIYTKSKQNCKFSIGDGDTIKKGSYQNHNGKQKVALKNDYEFLWDTYTYDGKSDKIDKIQFLKLLVKRPIEEKS